MFDRNKRNKGNVLGWLENLVLKVSLRDRATVP